MSAHWVVTAVYASSAGACPKTVRPCPRTVQEPTNPWRTL